MRKLLVLVGVLAALGCSSAPTRADLVGAGGSGAISGAGAGGGSASTAGGGGSAGAGIDCAPAAVPITVEWDRINGQGAPFYQTPEAIALANNILFYQNADSGWPKDTDMTTTTARHTGSTIDNKATTTQIEYLSRVYGATGCAAFGDAAVAGIEYLFAGQYDNGGWPQEFPNGEDYHTHITFNDDAMVRVLELFRKISRRVEPYAYLDESFEPRASEAVERGIDCILACQVVTDDVPTGWCAQHDEVTLEPAQARSYELPSLSGSEAVGIVRFLMTIEEPSAEVRAAIDGAVAWFEAVKITGIRVDTIADPNQPSGEDVVVVEDPQAAPIWARFYELGTNRPIFSSRCEVPECDDDPYFMVRYSLAEIDNERRVGYAWYGNWPTSLLAVEYPAWQARWPAP